MAEDPYRAKLQNIYHAIDQHNYNRALKLTQNKSISDLEIVLALRAHTYERLKKKDEALTTVRRLLVYLLSEEDDDEFWLLRKYGSDKNGDGGLDLIEILDGVKGKKCDKVENTSGRVITDETTLSTIAITLRAYRMYKVLIRMYNHALSSLPPSTPKEIQITLLQHLFYAQLNHCISSSSMETFESMRNTCMQLARLTQSNLYLSWAASSAYLQCQFLRKEKEYDASKYDLLLRFSEGFAKRVVSSDAVCGEDWRLYTCCLESQKKYEEAMDVWNAIPTSSEAVDNASGASSTRRLLIPQREKEERVADMAFAAGFYDVSEKTYRDLWIRLNKYSCGLGMLHSAWEDSKLAGLERCHDLLLQQSSNDNNLETEHRDKRGIYLLLLEMESTKIQKNEGASYDYIALADGILRYLEKLSTTTSCCLSDLKPFLKLLLEKAEPPVIIETLGRLEVMRKKMLPQDGSSSITRNLLRGYIAACQIALEIWNCVDDANVEDGCALIPEIREMMDIWQASIQDFGGGVPEGGQKEVLPGDELILLCCSILLNPKTKPQQHPLLPILQSAALLEHALQLSPYNPILKIYLILIYGQPLASAQRSLQLFSTLDVKQIQLDSLSHFLIPHALSSGFYPEAVAQCTSILSLHRNTAREMPDYVSKALDNNNLTQAHDMICFQSQRMKYSLQLLASKSVIMNCAPLLGGGDKNQTLRIGDAHGITGRNLAEDLSRVEKMIREIHDGFGALSLLSDCRSNDLKYSDNRQFFFGDLLSLSPPSSSIFTIPSKEELVSQAKATGFIHGLLLRTVLVVSVAKPPKKGKKQQVSPLLRMRCASLQTFLQEADASQLFEKDEFYNATRCLCRAIYAVCHNQPVDGLLEDTRKAISMAHESLSTGTTNDLYMDPPRLKKICILLPTRFLPLLAILETAGSLFTVYGWTKKRTKTKKEAMGLAKVAKTFAVLLDELQVFLSQSAMTSVDRVLSSFSGGNEEFFTFSSNTKQSMIFVIENMLSSQQLSRDKMISYLDQILNILNVYTAELPEEK